MYIQIYINTLMIYVVYNTVIIYREIEREHACTKSWTVTQLGPEVRVVLYHYCGAIQAVDLGDVMRTRLLRSEMPGFRDGLVWGPGALEGWCWLIVVNSG